MSAKRRTVRCSTCKADIGVTGDGERFLYHYTQGPGLGMPCGESGQSAAPKTEEAS